MVNFYPYFSLVSHVFHRASKFAHLHLQGGVRVRCSRLMVWSLNIFAPVDMVKDLMIYRGVAAT